MCERRSNHDRSYVSAVNSVYKVIIIQTLTIPLTSNYVTTLLGVVGGGGERVTSSPSLWVISRPGLQLQHGESNTCIVFRDTEVKTKRISWKKWKYLP